MVHEPTAVVKVLDDVAMLLDCRGEFTLATAVDRVVYEVHSVGRQIENTLRKYARKFQGQLRKPKPGEYGLSPDTIVIEFPDAKQAQRFSFFHLQRLGSRPTQLDKTRFIVGLAFATVSDTLAYEFEETRIEQLKRVGFSDELTRDLADANLADLVDDELEDVLKNVGFTNNVLTRDEDVAKKIAEERIDLIDESAYYDMY